MGAEHSFQVELALLKVQALLKNAHIGSRKSKAEIARGMGVHQSNITQVMQEGRSCTIITLARFLEACGYELEVGLKKISAEEPSIIQEEKIHNGLAAEDKEAAERSV